VIGTFPFEIGWSRSREAPPDGRVLPYIYIGTKRFAYALPLSLPVTVATVEERLSAGAAMARSSATLP